jgi:TadE-like protein
VIGRAGGRDRGSVTLEMVLITPLVLLLMQFIVFTGRFVDARSDVVSASRDAARAASIQRTAGDAVAMANETVDRTLAGEGIRCRPAPIVDVSFGGGGFAPGNYVHVQVTCGVRLSDLAWLNIPGTRSSTVEAVEVIDVYRGS